jgi:hypothetical protein
MSLHIPCSTPPSDGSLVAVVQDNAGDLQCALQFQVIVFPGWLQLITMHVRLW